MIRKLLLLALLCVPLAASAQNQTLPVTPPFVSQLGSIMQGPLLTGQSQFTTTGCSVSAHTGGATAGTYTSGTSGTCTVVITFNGATVSTFTGSTATNVLTDITHATGAISPGQLVTGASIPASTFILSTGTGTGNNNGGTYNLTTTPGTIGSEAMTTTGNLQAPNGWTCMAQDVTTPADAQKQTATTTYSATIAGTTASADVVVFNCQPY